MGNAMRSKLRSSRRRETAQLLPDARVVVSASGSRTLIVTSPEIVLKMESWRQDEEGVRMPMRVGLGKRGVEVDARGTGVLRSRGGEE